MVLKHLGSVVEVLLAFLKVLKSQVLANWYPHIWHTTPEVIRQLVAEGHPITAEMLAVLSPYPTAHLNRLGRYSLQLDQVPDPIEYDLPDSLFPSASS